VKTGPLLTNGLAQGKVNRRMRKAETIEIPDSKFFGKSPHVKVQENHPMQPISSDKSED